MKGDRTVEALIQQYVYKLKENYVIRLLEFSLYQEADF